jgi:hypothetical protein
MAGLRTYRQRRSPTSDDGGRHEPLAVMISNGHREELTFLGPDPTGLHHFETGTGPTTNRRLPPAVQGVSGMLGFVTRSACGMGRHRSGKSVN